MVARTKQWRWHNPSIWRGQVGGRGDDEDDASDEGRKAIDEMKGEKEIERGGDDRVDGVLKY